MNIGKPHNPFSSHYVEPDRGGYIFPGGNSDSSLGGIIADLRKHQWRGELIGPHGAGKSTLLTDICLRAEDTGHHVARWQCNDQQRGLPHDWIANLRRADIIAVDGAERLYPGLLAFLRLIIKVSGKGLIITTHRKTRLGLCINVTPNAKCLSEKIAALVRADFPGDAPGGETDFIENVRQRLERHDGNAREVLFDLYLEYENQG